MRRDWPGDDFLICFFLMRLSRNFTRVLEMTCFYKGNGQRAAARHPLRG